MINYVSHLKDSIVQMVSDLGLPEDPEPIVEENNIMESQVYDYYSCFVVCKLLQICLQDTRTPVQFVSALEVRLRGLLKTAIS